ncbi:MAG: hypothetical protein R3C56_32485 [Pirellulaceae bacterium]
MNRDGISWPAQAFLRLILLYGDAASGAIGVEGAALVLFSVVGTCGGKS